jgi:hypothetical protein
MAMFHARSRRIGVLVRVLVQLAVLAAVALAGEAGKRWSL